ncbi:uncharacterized protein MONOS_16862 [Monocercomonoides exilis]|uniref:uncharacterized protein n=1 Tax=Monocercomonoides exilis TaxID=2049356 RepID=UPI0035594E48|nr:hypothetical protein MONOS_16862 [Monocercomonoides exilis]
MWKGWGRAGWKKTGHVQLLGEGSGGGSGIFGEGCCGIGGRLIGGAVEVQGVVTIEGIGSCEAGSATGKVLDELALELGRAGAGIWILG